MPIPIKARAVGLNPDFQAKKRTIPTASSPPINAPIGLKFVYV